MAAAFDVLSWVIIYSLTITIHLDCVIANFALGRDVQANVTCGNPPEQYYQNWQGSYQPQYRKPFICNASSQLHSHPPRLMVDGNNATYWQSKAKIDVAYIDIDLRSANQKFIFVRNIDISFGAYQRPGQISYSKSTDGGRTYQPWHFYVSTQGQCQSVFSRSYQSRPFHIDSILCTTYPRYVPLKANETVSVNLYGGRASSNNLQLQQWMNATNIRLRFSQLYRKFDPWSAKWHHYTVSEISVTGSCFCSGHASVCNVNATNGERSCKCQNNACGPRCDRCCPAYNQYAWKMGTKAPFEIDAEAACKPCNCHNHSSVCIFNQTIAAARRSLNASGYYSGGGVCQNCEHNTTGINCEMCKPFFFRPTGKSKLHTDVCKECNCNRLGTRNAPGVAYLDCIRDQTVNVTGMNAGDCYCKQNVFRRQCNECRPGFFNLTAANPRGCQNCSCFLPGTVNGSNVCVSDATGTCPCKRNTEGRACHTCKDTFFNLTAQNPNGCQECACNPGGGNSTVCNKTSGQCLCKSTNITGRQCDRPRDEYYYPNLHFLRYTIARTSPSPGTSFRGQLTVPSYPGASGVYRIILKYTSPVAANGVLTIVNTGATVTVTMAGSVVLSSTCTSACYTYVDRRFTLTANTWATFLAISLANTADATKITIDHIILLPEEFHNATFLGSSSNSFLRDCNVLTNNMTKNGVLDPVCLNGVFTLTVGLMEDTIECGCNMTGSVNNNCEKYDGQCVCKPGVTGKKCDRCLSRFYNFTSSGCSPCNCQSDNKVCSQTTGQCVCPANVIGRNCSQCESLYWGWNGTTGCQACGCNSTGSTGLQCDLLRGNCSCKYGIGGSKCTQCIDGFTGFSTNGCQSCNCSRNGSLSSVCNKETNQCPCKLNTVGRTCDQCNAQSFYLSSEHVQGCLSCICMGITSNCSSSSQHKYQEILSPYLWKIGFESTLINTATVNSTIGNGAQSIPAVSASIQNNTRPVFWTAPRDFLQRSWVTAYGGWISFTLFYTNATVATFIDQQYAILKGKGISIYQNITKTYPGLINVRRIELTEGSWHFLNGSTISRSDLLLALAKPQALLISASSYMTSSNPHTTSIGGLTISSSQLNVTSSGRALQVESCQCGPGYAGSSCERCATGYKRSGVSTHAYLGTCTLCECNGHSNECDPDTGRCLNCLHNTTGEHCQVCQAGFYGNATQGTSSDCQRCPCDAPRTTSSLCELDNGGIVRCLNCSTGYEGATCERCTLGYYGQPMLPGGFCQSCQCTNNSDICNTTSGVCQNCQFNTSGDRCERCRDGWYGDAVARTCQACNCNLTGSRSNVCNHTTGVCRCRENVIGRYCTACQVNTYGFNNVTGCLPCNCNPMGSLRLQCNESGFCACQNQTIGQRCNTCEAGFFGLPVATCQACNCNTTGSRNMSCSTASGQCFCKIGVHRRQCTDCMKQHINFNSSGCTACPGCSQLLQRKINAQDVNVQQTYTNLQSVKQKANLTSQLLATEQELNRTQIAKQQFDSRISTLQAGIRRIRSDALSNSVNGLLNRTNRLTNKSAILLNTSQSEAQRFQQIRLQSEQAANNVISVNSSIRSIVAELENLKTLSERMLASTRNLNAGFVHQSELQFAQNNASDAASLLTQMQNAGSSVILQNNQFNKSATDIANVQQNLTIQQRSFLALQDQAAMYQTHLEGIQRNITAVKSMDNSTNTTLGNTTVLLNEVDMYITNISMLLAESQAALKTTNEMIYNATGLERSLNSVSNDANELQTNLTNIRPKVNRASSHANNLTQEANRLTRTFQTARLHGSNAVNAVKRYEEISKLINQSMELSKKANVSIQQVLNYLQTSGNQNMTRKATVSLAESRRELSISTNQRTTLTGLQSNFSRVNTTFDSVTAIGRRVSSRNNVFISSLNSLSRAGEYGIRPHSIELAAMSSDRISNEVVNNMSRTSQQCKELKKNVTAMATMIETLNSTSLNATRGLALAWITANNITSKLNSSTDAPLNHVNTITRIIQQFNSTTKPTLEQRLARIQSKLDAVKQRIAKLQAAMKLNGSNSVTYKPAASSIAQSAYSEIAMDFRTTQTNTFLMFFGNQSLPEADKMSLKVVRSKVVFEYTINGRTRSLTNWEVGVSDGNWRRVYASRQGDFSRLTVSMLTTNYSRTYSSQGESTWTMMRYPSTSLLYVGGLSQQQMVNSTVSSFKGCINNVRLNKQEISLWNSSTFLFKPGYCNASYPISQTIRTIMGTSFYGNGYVQLRMGNFSIRNESYVEFEFRTFMKNGTLFAVQNARNEIIYAITLVDGSVHFSYVSPFSRVKTERNSYADGNTYKVSLSRSTNHVALTVTSVLNGTGEPTRGSMTSLPLLDEGTAVFFGGVNSSSSGQLGTNYNFAGCIMNINMSNSLTGKNDPVSLNNANLLQYSTGVDFNGCLAQVGKGLRFLGNGYASVTTTSSRLTSLEIVFKTSDGNGVLFYAEKDGMKFYVALLHGNVFLHYKNASRNVRTELFTRTQTLNDGAYHNLRIAFSNSLMSMTVGGTASSVQLQSGLAPSVELNGKLYVGGVSPQLKNSLDEFPVSTGFKGDMSKMNVNEQTFLNTLITLGKHMSLAGVPQAETVYPTPLPTTPAPTTPPPSCAASSGEPRFASAQNWVGFQSTSLLGLRSPNAQTVLAYLRINYLMQIDFRAFSTYGVIFFASNPSRSQFISLELVNGKLVYQFNAGPGRVKMTTTNDYAQGVWTKVSLLRLSQFGAMLISATKEYKNNENGSRVGEMNLQFPFYVGSVPEAIPLNMLQNPSGRNSFRGCVRNVQIQDSTQGHTFDLSLHRDSNVTKGLRQCYHAVVPTVRLSGNGYFLAERNIRVSSTFAITIKFRTSQRNGVIWHLTNPDSSRYLLLEQVSGQIILTSLFGSGINRLIWTDPNLVNKPANMSYFVCNNAFHTITVSRASTNYTINVDTYPVVTGPLEVQNLVGSLYVGGSPQLSNAGISGCIQSLVVNNQAKDISAAVTASSSNVFSGCAG